MGAKREILLVPGTPALIRFNTSPEKAKCLVVNSAGDSSIQIRSYKICSKTVIVRKISMIFDVENSF